MTHHQWWLQELSWSSLWPETKHCREIAWTIFIYLLLYFPFNKKQEHVLGYSFPSDIFGPNISRGRSRRMPDKQHLRTWELHRLQHLDMPWWRTTTEGDLNSIHLKFCKLQVWGEICEYPEVSSFLNWYLVLELVCNLASCPIKKWKKNERSCHGDNIESSSTNHHGKYSQCPAFDIKQSPAGRSPEDHQVCTHAYLSLNKAQSCLLAPFIYSHML
jgi:hypothetical protein